MPPKNAPAKPARRKGPAFNPPRPVNASSQPTIGTKRAPAAASRANSAAKKSNATASRNDDDDDNDDDNDNNVVDIDSDDFDSIMEDVAPAPTHSTPPPANPALVDPVVPRPLLARLLLENFDDPNIQIQTGAMKLVGKYIDIFVTEAFLRSKDERRAAAKDGRVADGFLQVDDLEKLAPQLVLDF
ncbi:cenp-s complex centromere x [Pyrenophora seminiperda CCB06]|uniref:Cenp-s complex centromere x n=1 Tax=Pyrenophora seminiperda CCB06 TaxID=1302712 RepID=A0A3M7MFD9_9PLEO|nr:cenp-s complex centromere x [Pyrenophora seminiperda CCB06]